MELFDLVENFYLNFSIPISIYDSENIQKVSYGYPQKYAVPVQQINFRYYDEIGIAIVGDGFYFAQFSCKSTAMVLLIGPLPFRFVSRAQAKAYMRTAAIDSSMFEELMSYFRLIPPVDYDDFLKLTGFLYYTVNEKPADLLNKELTNLGGRAKDIEARKTELAYINRDMQLSHRTYDFEQQMIRYVREGKTELLKRFVMTFSHEKHSYSGMKFNDMLRWEKDTFIGALYTIGKYGAIPGGVPVEDAYSMIDQFVREAEMTSSISAVRNMHYTMLVSFSEKVAQMKGTEGVSQEIFTCIQYIYNHINVPIFIEDLTSLLFIGKTTLCRKFKNETGLTVNDFINKTKMDEAALLLELTDKSISEISSYLGYSSQPYFQKVFKKWHQTTPDRFRKESVSEKY